MEDFLDELIRKKDPEAYRKMQRRDLILACVGVVIIIGTIALGIAALC